MLKTEEFDEPTLKVPGLVTVKVPPEKIQLSAVEPFSMIILTSATSPSTASTVILASATKSVVAAMTGRAKNKANTVTTRNFFIVLIELLLGF